MRPLLMRRTLAVTVRKPEGLNMLNLSAAKANGWGNLCHRFAGHERVADALRLRRRDEGQSALGSFSRLRRADDGVKEKIAALALWKHSGCDQFLAQRAQVKPDRWRRVINPSCEHLHGSRLAADHLCSEDGVRSGGKRLLDRRRRQHVLPAKVAAHLRGIEADRAPDRASLLTEVVSPLNL